MGYTFTNKLPRKIPSGQEKLSKLQFGVWGVAWVDSYFLCLLPSDHRNVITVSFMTKKIRLSTKKDTRPHKPLNHKEKAHDKAW